MITYKSAGVDVNAGNRLVQRIKKFAPRIGGFSDGMPLPAGIRNPILIGCADGVGTKLAIAQALNIHHNIGYDLVGMNLNDLICSGARPLFFLDYFATGKLNVDQTEKVVKSIARACREGLCQLLGGETAEMPGFYKPGEYDLAGFATGVVSKSQMLKPKQNVRSGDILLGLPSSGLHSNGYSLVRKIIKRDEWKKNAADLLRPTKLYVKEVLNALEHLNKGNRQGIKGLVHVTGGGFTDNIPRILPKHLSAQILRKSWPVPKIMQTIQKRAHLSDDQMFRTFNMGIGMIAVVSPKWVIKAKKLFKRAYVIGEIKRGNQSVKYI